MNRFMKEAISEAYSGIENGEGGPFGCVIVRNGKIIGRGHNQVILNNDPTCHGEIMAIKDACGNLGTFDLNGCELYTTGEPCPMCLGAIKWANIEKVYYGCNVSDTEKIGFRDRKFYESDGNRDFLTEIDREECLELYEKYSDSENKREY